MPRDVIVTLRCDDEGHHGPSIRPECYRCKGTTRSAYTCDEIAETAARLLGWAPTKHGYLCADCIDAGRQGDQSGQG